jgi:hypothetical protein
VPLAEALFHLANKRRQIIHPGEETFSQTLPLILIGTQRTPAQPIEFLLDGQQIDLPVDVGAAPNQIRIAHGRE